MSELFAFLLGLLNTEISELAPWLANQLIIWYSKYLPEEDRERYRDEFLADLEALPGKISKLILALAIISSYFAQRAALYAPVKVWALLQGVFDSTIAPQFPQSRSGWWCVGGYTFFGLATMVTPIYSQVKVSVPTYVFIFFLPILLSTFGAAFASGVGVVFQMSGIKVESRKKWLSISYSISRLGFGTFAILLGVLYFVLRAVELLNPESGLLSPLIIVGAVSIIPMALFGNIVSKTLLKDSSKKFPDDKKETFYRYFELGLMTGTLTISIWSIAMFFLSIL
jgi:hypothetical protein